MSTEARLTVGDTVLWAGSFGHDPYKKAKVIGIERTNGRDKYGVTVESMDWSEVPDKAVVSLDNNHWAYGSQLKRL